MKLRFKFVMSMLLVFAMLTMVSSVYAHPTQEDLKMKLVSDKQLTHDIVKLLFEKEQELGLSEYNKAQVTKSLKGIAYFEHYDGYIAYFEADGWGMTAVYDKDKNVLLDSMKIEIGSDMTTARRFDGQQKTFTKQETEIMMTNDCRNCEQQTAYTYSKPSAFESLFLDGVASASHEEPSEQAECGWWSIPTCFVVGFMTGIIGGLVCEVGMQWACNYT